MSSRSLLQRTCLILALLALAVCLFYIGKGHTLFLDTNTITIEGKELRSYSSVNVSVNGKELNSPMGRSERVRVTVSGPRHKIVITDEAGVENKVEKTFTIPTFIDRAVVSIPAIIAGSPAEYWVTPFTPPSPQDTPVEKMYYYVEEEDE